MTRFLLLFIAALYISSCKPSSNTSPPNPETEKTKIRKIGQAQSSFSIDGFATEIAWEKQPWHAIAHTWLGEPPSKEDFAGRYKLTWSESHLYVLAEITDDTLVDTHINGLDKYWDDDCLEIFVDENASKGNHQFNHNAFAYHISLEGVVTDIGTDSLPRYYDHVKSQRITTGNKTIWEAAIEIHPDSYKDGIKSAPLKLFPGKKMGFAIAYCDNDHSVERENFIGSIAVKGEDKNRGWIDAGIFESVILAK